MDTMAEMDMIQVQEALDPFVDPGKDILSVLVRLRVVMDVTCLIDRW